MAEKLKLYDADGNEIPYDMPIEPPKFDITTAGDLEVKSGAILLDSILHPSFMYFLSIQSEEEE